MVTEGALKECTNTLLRSPEKMPEWLSISDKYMQTYAENPETFLMPRAHEFLKPLIEAYAENLEGFTQYLLGLRDCFDRKSSAFKELQAIYRRVGGRYTQQLRRERINRAVAKAEELFGVIPYTRRMQWMADVEHAWAKRRLSFLEAQRLQIQEDHLPAELRIELLAEFWEGIDNEIYEGKIPPWSLPNRGATLP